MQGDIFYCIAYMYVKRYKHMEGDIFYCIEYMYARRCQFLYLKVKYVTFSLLL